MKRLLLVLGVLVLLAAGVVEWANAAWNAPGPPAAQGNATVVVIAPHTGLAAIARQLTAAHVLTRDWVFRLGLHLRGLAGQVKAGEYAVPSRASMADIAALMVAGRVVQHRLTAAEGLTSDMIWKLVKADPVLTGDAGPVPPEGALLPETYLFTLGTTRTGLLARMEKAQQAFLAAAWARRAPGLPLKSMREAVILASIVEKESALPEERRHIAGVFLNRLKAGMKLQSDPTIIYGITKGYPLGRPILESEIAAATPWNTYVIAGLPPGPICNPGKNALEAVLLPEATDDLYFVATGKGGHVFSATMAQHLRNVAALRAAEKAKAQAEDPAPPPPPKAPPHRRHRHRKAS